jgi:hypothetical protein
LINSLYREIKLELADAMMSDLPRKKNVRSRLQHVWDGYVNFGIANPEQRKVLAQLKESDILTKDSREAGNAPFVEVQTMIRNAIKARVFRDDLPVELVSGPWAPWPRRRWTLWPCTPARRTNTAPADSKCFAPV